MRDPRQRLRRSARRLIMRPPPNDGEPPIVYGIRTVRTEDLLEQGFADLVGTQDVVEASRVEGVEETQRAHEMDAATSPEERAAVEARHKAQDERASVARWEALVKTPERQRALMSQMEAYICAAVEAVGNAQPDAADRLGDGLVPQHEPEAVVCENLEEDPSKPPVYLVPFRFVRNVEQADHAHMWVGALGQWERVILGGAIMAAQRVADQIRPFSTARNS